MNVTRRDFMKISGVTVAGAALSQLGFDLAPVYHLSLSILFHKACISTLLDPLCNLIECPLPTNFFPLITVRCTIPHFFQATIVDRNLVGSSTFRTERSLTNGMIGISLAVNYLSGFVSGNEDATSHRTVTTYGGSLFCPLDPELSSLCMNRCKVNP